MIYYLIFFILFLFSLFDLSDKKNIATRMLEKYLYFVAMLILICFAGFRFDTGWDYAGYRYYYDLIPTIDQLVGNGEIYNSIYFEPGFKILMSVAKTCGLSFYSFQFFISFICISLISRALKYERKKLLFLLIYFSTCYLFLNMSFLRQGLAVAFLYMAVMAIFTERKKVAFFYLIVGSFFHLSVLILIPVFYIVDKKKISDRFIYVIIASAIILYILQIHWLKTSFGAISPIFPHDISYKINSYLESERFGKSRDIGFGVVEKLFTFLVLLYIHKKDNSKKSLILLRFFMFYMITYFAFYEITVLYDRLRFYFVALNVLAYLSIFNFFSKYNRVVVYFVIVLYSLFSYFNIFRSDFNRVVFIPYHNIFESENVIPSEQKGDLRLDRARDMDR